MGLVGLAADFIPSVMKFGPIEASMPIGLVMPMMASLAWGWRYGLISATVGLGSIGMLMRWNLGWGFVAYWPFVLCWICWHGLWAQNRAKRPRWYNLPYVVEIPYRLTSAALIYPLFQALFRFNPAPWGGVVFSPADIDSLNLAMFIDALGAYIVLLLAVILLRLRWVDRLMGLRRKSRVALGPLLAWALLFWMGYCVLDALFAYVGHPGEKTFMQALLTGLMGHEWATRGMFLLGCLAGALTLAGFVERYQRTQRQLERSEMRFSRIIERSHVPMVITTRRQGHLFSMNDAWLHHFGYDRQVIKSLDDWYRLAYPDPECRNRARTAWEKAAAKLNSESGAVLSQRWSVRDAQGERRDIDFYHTSLGDGIGITSFIDVTEQLRAHREMVRSKAVLQGASEQSLAGIVILGAKGPQPLFINHEAARIFGLEGDLPPQETMAEAEAARAWALEKLPFLKGIMAGRRFNNQQSLISRPSGGDVWVVAGGSPVRDDLGEIMAGMLVVQDITTQKMLEEQLRQSQKMQAVGTLASGIAHDFNNILQAIGGFVELISTRGGTVSDNQSHLDQITRAAERAAGLIRGLLTFGRKLQPRLRPLDLNAEVEQTVELIRRTIPAMIQVETSLARGLPRISADSIQLEQVLMNLASNARDAMRDGGRLRIETSLRRVGPDDEPPPGDLPPGRYVLLRVLDTGTGMDGRVLERIFDPFFTTKEVGQGTGLGLSTVYGIVKGHGGEILCTSTPEKGTEFVVWLPALDEPAMVAEPPAAGAPRPAARSGAGARTVLVVDDEPDLLTTVQSYLASRGHTVVGASCGEQALELYAKHAFDVVVLDLGMPGMGGRACMRSLLETDPSAKIIVASGYLELKGEDWLDMGATDTLGKPYRLDELARIVEDLPA